MHSVNCTAAPVSFFNMADQQSWRCTHCTHIPAQHTVPKLWSNRRYVRRMVGVGDELSCNGRRLRDGYAYGYGYSGRYVSNGPFRGQELSLQSEGALEFPPSEGEYKLPFPPSFFARVFRLGCHELMPTGAVTCCVYLPRYPRGICRRCER